MKKGFTLVELLVVVLLISIVYGVYFFTAPHSSKAENFSLFNVKKYLQIKSREYGEKLTLICNNDSEKCYILDVKKEIVEEIDYEEKVTAYTLKNNEELEPTRFKNLELSDTLYFEPNLIFKKLSEDLFQTLIYNTQDNKWVYISPHFNDTQTFINKEELISYIKKRHYLPVYSGLAE